MCIYIHSRQEDALENVGWTITATVYSDFKDFDTFI